MDDNTLKLARLLNENPSSIDILPGDGREWIEMYYPDVGTNIESNIASSGNLMNSNSNLHAPFLFLEGNLGVPQKVLYQCYMRAVKVFSEIYQGLRSRSEYDRDLKSSVVELVELQLEQAKRILQVTSVILLANPAHQTALNARKDAILTILLSDSYKAQTSDKPGTIITDEQDDEEKQNQAITTSRILEHHIEKELSFIAALLSLKQSSKVAPLWYHRRALLCALHFGNLRSDGSQRRTEDSDIHNSDHDLDSIEPPLLSLRYTDIDFTNVSTTRLFPASALKRELNLAERACEVYPRNYYAWYHRILCMQACAASIRFLRHKLCPCTLPDSTVEASGHSDTNAKLKTGQVIEAQLKEHETLLVTEFASSQQWVARHVSDHSAIHYLCGVAEDVDALGLFKPSSSQPPSAISNPSNSSSSSSLPFADSAPSTSLLKAIPTSAALQCAQQAHSLCASYPTHETLWLYLRRSVASVITTSPHPSSFDPSSAGPTTESSLASADEIGIFIGGRAPKPEPEFEPNTRTRTLLPSSNGEGDRSRNQNEVQTQYYCQYSCQSRYRCQERSQDQTQNHIETPRRQSCREIQRTDSAHRDQSSSPFSELESESEALAFRTLMNSRRKCEESRKPEVKERIDMARVVVEAHTAARHAAEYLLWRARSNSSTFTEAKLLQACCPHFTDDSQSILDLVEVLKRILSVH